MSEDARSGLRDPWTLAVLAVAVACLAFSWRLSEGYQLADSVEYLERARDFVRPEGDVAHRAIRSFAFSACFVPLYVVNDALGLESSSWIVPAARVFVIALALLWILSTIRIGERVGGRVAGLGAGLLLAVNPIFLRYGIAPLTGIPAALCVSLALERSLERGGFRQHLAAGLWFGAAFMMAYQTFLVAAAVLGLVFLRDRFRHFRTTAGGLCGFSLGVLFQVALDRIAYGEWGASVVRYLAANVGAVLTRVLWQHLGMRELGEKVFDWYLPYVQQEGDEKRADTSEVVLSDADLEGADWYVTHLPEAVVWPALVVALFGVAFVARRRGWLTLLPLAAFVACVAVMSQKGAKDFRLWLPLLPLFLPVLAGGLALVRGTAARPGLARSGLVAALLVAATAFGIRELERSNPTRFAVYWEAIAWVEDRVARGFDERADAPRRPDSHPAGARPRVTAAYHWAIYERASSDLWTGKLSRPLDEWRVMLDEDRDAVAGELAEFDWFLCHLPVLSTQPELLRVVNERFSVEAAFYSPSSEPGLGPVFCLRRRRDGSGRRFFRTHDVDPEVFAATRELSHASDFAATVETADGPREERLRLLGFGYEVLPGSEHGWLTYHWTTPTGLSRDYVLTDRLTCPDERVTWQNDHEPAYGVLPATALVGGKVLEESYYLVAGEDPYARESAFRPLGGPYRRGERIPASLWAGVIEFDDAGERVRRLEPVDPRTGAALALEAGGPPSARGRRLSKDGLSLVGRLLLPRHADAFVPDDGRTEP